MTHELSIGVSINELTRLNRHLLAYCVTAGCVEGLGVLSCLYMAGTIHSIGEQLR
jgi:hypothetical protein